MSRLYRDLSYWHDSAAEFAESDFTPRPALPGDLEVDVAVVGAGYTGLWTAYYLARADPSARIVVLEREVAGFGASGRNGGWCSALFPASLAKVARLAGRLSPVLGAPVRQDACGGGQVAPGFREPVLVARRALGVRAGGEQPLVLELLQAPGQHVRRDRAQPFLELAVAQRAVEERGHHGERPPVAHDPQGAPERLERVVHLACLGHGASVVAVRYGSH